MALKWEEIQRLRFECGYNITGVGAELYVLNGYAAVFDAAIAPYLIDFGSSSSTVIAAAAGTATITLASNPAVYGPTGPTVNVYGLSFQQGSRLVVDVGPNQETSVILLSIAGLSVTIGPVNLAHGGYAYPVTLMGGEWMIRDIISRLDVLNAQVKGYAPGVAGLAQADDAKFFASQQGRKGQKGVFDDLMAQRDMARKDLCSALGIPNLWEQRGKLGGGADGGGLSYGRF